ASPDGVHGHRCGVGLCLQQEARSRKRLTETRSEHVETLIHLARHELAFERLRVFLNNQLPSGNREPYSCLRSPFSVRVTGEVSAMVGKALVPGPGLEPGYSAPKADVLPIRRSRS